MSQLQLQLQVQPRDSRESRPEPAFPQTVLIWLQTEAGVERGLKMRLRLNSLPGKPSPCY